MELFLGIIIGLIVLVILIVLHELGHALVAMRNGVVVEEFGIGFPPRAWKKRLKNGVLFTLNWLPLGGFVRLKGEYDSATGEGTYGGASFWVKTKILVAGVVVNWVTAVLLFTILLLVGMPKMLENQVTLPFDTTVNRSELTIARVTPSSPADKAGLKAGDNILSIGKSNVQTPQELIDQTKASAGQTVEINFIRDGSPETKTVTLNTQEQAVNGGFLGVAPQQSETIHSTWSAPILGVATAGQLTYETFKGVGSLIYNGITGFFGQFFGSDASRQEAKQNLETVGDSVAGPIGILGVLFPSMVSAGPVQVLLLAGIISLTLAVMNFLPIPALDGGRWWTMAGFRLFRKKLTKEREENIQATGFLILMALTILVTWNDIGRFF